jgi:hypothetical protein
LPRRCGWLVLVVHFHGRRYMLPYDNLWGSAKLLLAHYLDGLNYAIADQISFLKNRRDRLCARGWHYVSAGVSAKHQKREYVGWSFHDSIT